MPTEALARSSLVELQFGDRLFSLYLDRRSTRPMDIDPLEVVEKNEENSSQQNAKNRLNAMVAVTVACLATFIGICHVKDDNIVQGMQQAQADKLDHWAYYQARNIRSDIARSTITQLQLQAVNSSGSQRAQYATQIAAYQAIATKQDNEKAQLKLQAEQDQKTYDGLNFHDDQFDLADAAVSIAISLLAVTALTNKSWLYWVALVPTGFGIIMGGAGLLNLDIHPDALTKLLSQAPVTAPTADPFARIESHPV
jgi:Domain of unknown function (DUF4337)